MALTRDYKDSIRERAEKDPMFAVSLMNEAASVVSESVLLTFI